MQQKQLDLFIFTFAGLFSVANPLGTLPIFVGLTTDDSAKERSKTALLTVINTFVIFVVSFYVGEYILNFFGISINSLRIAGGLIIISSGFALLTGSFHKHKGMERERIKNDLLQRDRVSLTPLAIPMLAGPGAISLLISLHEKHQQITEDFIIVSAIFLVCFATFLMLKSSHYIVKYLGASGINAISRIIGFIVIAIGIEYISSSILALIEGIN